MNRMTLYELGQDYWKALDGLTDPDNELPPEVIADTLEGLQGSVEDKAVNLAKFFRNLETAAEAIKSAEERMARRRRTLEGRVRWLKGYLKENLEACGIEKVESPWFVLAIQKNPASVEVVDEAAIPAAFKAEVVTVKLDKAGIKRAIEAGQSVPGATLTRGTRLAVR